MDLKLRGITWVGNIYQKFEAVCQEVDDIVSQDTVKYVETRVHSMGENVKRFYSEVVQDLLPPLSDPAGHGPQAVAQEGNHATDPCFKSMIRKEENPIDTASKESAVGTDACVPAVEDPIDADSKEFTVRTDACAHAMEEKSMLSDSKESSVDTDAYKTGKEEDFTETDNKDSTAESDAQDPAKEENSIDSDGKKSSAEIETGSLSEEEPSTQAWSEFHLTNEEYTQAFANFLPALESEAIVENNDDSCLTEKESEDTDEDNEFRLANEEATQVLDNSFPDLESEEIVENNNDSFVAEKESEDNDKDNAIMEHAPNVQNLESPSEHEEVVESVCLESNKEIYERDYVSFAVDLSPERPTVCNDLGEDTECLSFPSSVLTSTEDADPLITCTKTMAEIGSSSSCNHLSEESCTHSENSEEIFSGKEKFPDDPFGMATHLSDQLSAYCINKAMETEIVSTKIASVQVESFAEENTSNGEETANLPGPSGGRHVGCGESTTSEAFSPTIDIGVSDNSSGVIPGSAAENVDMAHKVTLEDSCVIVDYGTLHAISRRTQRLRSYRRRIQDALASRRRLVKEYEQLAIWFGDTDIDGNGESSEKLLLSNQTSVQLQMAHPCDSEWELL